MNCTLIAQPCQQCGLLSCHAGSPPGAPALRRHAQPSHLARCCDAFQGRVCCRIVHLPWIAQGCRDGREQIRRGDGGVGCLTEKAANAKDLFKKQMLLSGSGDYAGKRRNIPYNKGFWHANTTLHTPLMCMANLVLNPESLNLHRHLPNRYDVAMNCTASAWLPWVQTRCGRLLGSACERGHPLALLPRASCLAAFRSASHTPVRHCQAAESCNLETQGFMVPGAMPLRAADYYRQRRVKFNSAM